MKAGRRGLFLAAAVCFAAAALAGCHFPEPLAPGPEALIDPWLLGNWNCLVKGLGGYRMEVAAEGGGRYVLTLRQKGSEVAIVMPMHFSSHARVRIANIDGKNAGAEDDRWLLLRPVRIGDDLLHVQFPSIRSVPELRGRLHANPEDPELYETYAACIKDNGPDVVIE